MTHSPSEAQGRWKLRSQPVSRHVMVAPLSPQTKQCWKDHSVPISSSPRASRALPRCWAGCWMWLLLGHTLQICWWMGLLCWTLCGAAGSKTFVPELVGRAGISFLMSGLSSHKPLLAQMYLFLSGPHLLCCPVDCMSNILREKSPESDFFDTLLRKLVGKKLQKRKNEELMRTLCQGLPGRKLEGAPGELTRQNSWARSLSASSLCPQVSGSAAAR